MSLEQVSLFETPLLIAQNEGVESLNKALRESILAREQVCPGMKRSNASLTWHSKYDMDKWLDPEVWADLCRLFKTSFTNMAYVHAAKPGSDLQFRFQPWAMVSRKGDYAVPHTHPNAHFSAVYYVSMPDNGSGRYKESGCIEFLDTRGGPGTRMIPGMVLNPRHLYAPKPGMLITFPAWLPHMVHPYDGHDVRIAIAANATITRYNPST